MRFKQNGSTIVWYLIALAMGVGLIYVNFINKVSLNTRGALAQEQSVYLNKSKEIIEAWYKNNAWEIDSKEDALTSDEIVTNTALVKKYGVNVVSSKRLNKGGIYYHVIAVWIPDVTVSGTSFNVDTGEFNSGDPYDVVKYALINGYLIESQKVLETYENIDATTKLLEDWFYAKVKSSPVEDADKNWFRKEYNDATDPTNNITCFDLNDGNFLDCYDSPVDIKTMLSGQGISDSMELTNAWGKPIYATNSIKFTVSISTNAPWGYLASGLAKGR